MPHRVLPLAAGLLAVAVTGCGGGGDGSSTPAPSSAATPKPEDFPKGADLNFSDLQSKYPAQLSLGVGASVMRQGENRVPFVGLDKGARPGANAPVRLHRGKAGRAPRPRPVPGQGDEVRRPAELSG